MRNKFTEYRTLIAAFLTLGIAGWISAAAAINGLMNSSDSSGGSQPGAGQGNSQTTGVMNQISPQMLQAFQQLMGVDPSGYINAGNNAGNMYTNQSGQNLGYQQQLQGQAGVSQGAQSSLMGAGNALWNTAQDPQSALYAKTLQQVQDQSRNASSVRGIGMSPEAAGLENQATGNFNMDWQNQQLSRQLQAMQGMTGAYQGAAQQGALTGANLSGAAGFGQQAAGNMLQSGRVPFQTQQQAYGAPLQYGQQYGTTMNTAFNPNLADYNMGNANFNANQQQQSGTALTQAFGSNSGPGQWLNGLFSGGGGQSPYYSGGSGGSSWTSGFDLPMGG
jgi:hypothetical protein